MESCAVATSLCAVERDSIENTIVPLEDTTQWLFETTVVDALAMDCPEHAGWDNTTQETCGTPVSPEDTCATSAVDYATAQTHCRMACPCGDIEDLAACEVDFCAMAVNGTGDYSAGVDCMEANPCSPPAPGTEPLLPPQPPHMPSPPSAPDDPRAPPLGPLPGLPPFAPPPPATLPSPLLPPLPSPRSTPHGTRFCNSVGDPHVRTFSGHSCGVMGVGIIPLVDLVGVRVEAYSCGLRSDSGLPGSLNVGLAVAVGDDRVYIVNDALPQVKTGLALFPSSVGPLISDAAMGDILLSNQSDGVHVTIGDYLSFITSRVDDPRSPMGYRVDVHLEVAPMPLGSALGKSVCTVTPGSAASFPAVASNASLFTSGMLSEFEDFCGASHAMIDPQCTKMALNEVGRAQLEGLLGPDITLDSAEREMFDVSAALGMEVESRRVRSQGEGRAARVLLPGR